MSLIKETFVWERFDNSKLTLLREKFKLEKVVENGHSEFEKQVILKNWVFSVLPKGSPERDYSFETAIGILDDAKTGKKMWCTQFAFTYLQCATALGWYSRKLGVDSDHERGDEEMHHGVADIWSNDFQKWYVVDALNNLHYEKDGVPLNAFELRQEYLKNEAVDVCGILGNKIETRKYVLDDRGFDTPSNYYWFFISLRNNFFDVPGLYNLKTLLWIDDINRGKTWWRGGGSKGEVKKHPMYESQFIETNEFEVCFPKMNNSGK
jgi:hypothetical protein